MRKWWNWQTHHLEGVAPQGVGVQIPPSAPLFLIIVVLLQSGKGSDIAAAFSGQGSQTAFGPRGAATALSRATTWSAILFMVTSLSLGVMALRQGPERWLPGGKAP